MSTNRSGRSRDSVHNAISNGIPIIVQLGISNIPVLGKVYDVFLAIQMFVDTILNPENVANLIERNSIDEACKNNVNNMSKSLSSSLMIDAIISSAKQLNPLITEDELKRQILIQTSLYHRELIFPPFVCFADYINPDASAKKLSVSFSGPPTDDCKLSAESYFDAYYNYIDVNKTIYEEENFTNPSKGFITGFMKLAAQTKVEKDRLNYNIQFIIIGIFIGLSFVIVLILYLVKAKKEGIFSPKIKA
jgi:hypothetical protein